MIDFSERRQFCAIGSPLPARMKNNQPAGPFGPQATVQVCNSASMQVCHYASVQVCKCARTHFYIYSTRDTLKPFNLKTELNLGLHSAVRISLLAFFSTAMTAMQCHTMQCNLQCLAIKCTSTNCSEPPMEDNLPVFMDCSHDTYCCDWAW